MTFSRHERLPFRGRLPRRRRPCKVTDGVVRKYSMKARLSESLWVGDDRSIVRRAGCRRSLGECGKRIPTKNGVAPKKEMAYWTPG